MPSKPIRIDLEVISELDKLRPLSPSSYSDIIRKLLRSHQELARIEQFAMSGKDSTSAMIKLNHKPIHANKHTSKKPLASILLYCFNCQEQTPHKKLKICQVVNNPIDSNREHSNTRTAYKCSICGSKKNI